MTFQMQKGILFYLSLVIFLYQYSFTLTHQIQKTRDQDMPQRTVDESSPFLFSIISATTITADHHHHPPSTPRTDHSK